MNCPRGLSSMRFLNPSQRTLAFQSTLDPRTPDHIHHTLVLRRQSNHPSPRLVTKHYDPRFLPRPLTRVACLAYDVNSSFMITIPFTRRVALSCLVVPPRISCILLCFLWSKWETVVLDLPVVLCWWYLFIRLGARSFRSSSTPPHLTIPRYIFVLQEKKLRD